MLSVYSQSGLGKLYTRPRVGQLFDRTAADVYKVTSV